MEIVDNNLIDLDDDLTTKTIRINEAESVNKRVINPQDLAAASDSNVTSRSDSLSSLSSSSNNNHDFNSPPIITKTTAAIINTVCLFLPLSFTLSLSLLFFT